MRVLAAQAAIAFENAQLYEDMKSEVERRDAAERALRDALSELECAEEPARGRERVPAGGDRHPAQLQRDHR